MKHIIRTVLVALALGASGAYAQSASDSNRTQSQYDSQSAAGNSANWGVGG
jgi:hypothetical protein